MCVIMNICETYHDKSLVAVAIYFFALDCMISNFQQALNILIEWTVIKEQEEGGENATLAKSRQLKTSVQPPQGEMASKAYTQHIIFTEPSFFTIWKDLLSSIESTFLLSIHDSIISHTTIMS